MHIETNPGYVGHLWKDHTDGRVDGDYARDWTNMWGDMEQELAKFGSAISCRVSSQEQHELAFWHNWDCFQVSNQPILDRAMAQAAMVLPPLALRIIRENSTQHGVVSSQRVDGALLHACKLILKAGHIALFSPRFVWQRGPFLQWRHTVLESPMFHLAAWMLIQWTHMVLTDCAQTSSLVADINIPFWIRMHLHRIGNLLWFREEC